MSSVAFTLCSAACPGDQQRWGTRLTDPVVLRALANPARLRMLDVLQETGGATATQCAAVVGLTPSLCSWHLRQLAAAGLVADAGTGGDGRQRRWTSAVPSWQVRSTDIDADPLEAAAIDVAVTQSLLQASDATVEAFTVAAAQGGEQPPWREASLVSNMTLRVTAAELAALSEAVRDVLAPYTASRRPRPPDAARVVHAAVRLVPAGPPTDDRPPGPGEAPAAG